MVMLREPGARRPFNNSHRWLWVPAFAGTTKWASSYSLTSSRTSERSERDPGPITTNGYVAPSGGRRPFNNRHGTACAQAYARTTHVGAMPSRRPGQVSAANASVRGDDKVGEELFP